MGDKSNIEWTDATWNPITGCSKVSPGCAHCYAETLALTRLAGKPGYSGKPWTPENAEENVVLRFDRVHLPLRWKRPRRIFVNSMSDLFHELVPYGFIDDVVIVMAAAHWHSFQVLTKRPERMRAYFTDPDLPRRLAETATSWAEAAREPLWQVALPLPNVWLGTSVENQHWADVRIPELLATPAAVRFLSMEPLLGPVETSAWIFDRASEIAHVMRAPIALYRFQADVAIAPSIDWVIVGGESGPIHRPMDPEWVRHIRDDCEDAGVPFLFKQWGGRTSKAGGRELDGRTWDEYPQAVA